MVKISSSLCSPAREGRQATGQFVAECKLIYLVYKLLAVHIIKRETGPGTAWLRNRINSISPWGKYGVSFRPGWITENKGETMIF